MTTQAPEQADQAEEAPPWSTDAPELLDPEPKAPEAPAVIIPPWTPSQDQKHAFEGILDWESSAKGSTKFTLGGLAGTGKTTVTGRLAIELTKNKRIAFVTPTGKASQVLRRSLNNAGVYGCDVTTIHSLIYRPVEDKKTGRVIGWEKKPAVSYDLIIVDESSMVSTEQMNDLLSLNKPILFVGDHGQLSPVGDDPGLMRNPDARLEKIHRQAQGNPIIRLSHIVRNGAPDDVVKAFIEDIDDARVRWTRSWDDAVDFGKPPGMVLTHTNKLRRTMNLKIREMMFDSDEYDEPKIGETVICLKNKRFQDTGMLLPNGMRGVIVSEPHVSAHHVIADVEFDEPVGKVEKLFMCRHQFLREKTFAGFDEVPGEPRNWHTVGALVDYGGALTTHKAQGSQAQNVAVFVERSLGVLDEDERRRWLYTAATRASENLLLVF
jgi:exodeoxyribonuclease-5